jgi:hypothetical protein
MQVETGVRETTPGMAITVEIKIGSRRTISYLLSPLGDLEKLPKLAIADIFGVNSTESKREQSGIIGG